MFDQPIDSKIEYMAAGSGASGWLRVPPIQMPWVPRFSERWMSNRYYSCGSETILRFLNARSRGSSVLKRTRKQTSIGYRRSCPRWHHLDMPARSPPHGPIQGLGTMRSSTHSGTFLSSLIIDRIIPTAATVHVACTCACFLAYVLVRRLSIAGSGIPLKNGSKHVLLT